MTENKQDPLLAAQVKLSNAKSDNTKIIKSASTKAAFLESIENAYNQGFITNDQFIAFMAIIFDMEEKGN